MVFIVNILGILIYLTVLIVSIVIIECQFALKGLQMIYIFFIILSQIMLNIYIDFLGHSLILGSINFSMLFLIIDLINEKYGKHEANKVVWSGIFVLVLFLFQIFFVKYFASKTDSYFVFLQLFGNQIRYILIDIAVSYIIFQFVNIAIFSSGSRMFFTGSLLITLRGWLLKVKTADLLHELSASFIDLFISCW